MPLSLDPNKSAQRLTLSLQKAGINRAPSSEIAIIMDVSGSFDDEHRDGQTQMLLERLVPWAMVFDPNKQGDVFTFSSGPGSAHHVGTLTLANLDGYIRREIIEGRVPGYGDATDYAYVLELVLKYFGWLPSAAQRAPERGFFGSMFGRKPAAPAAGTPAQKRRSLVFFVTDGDNGRDDKQRTMDVLRASQDRRDEVYFIFIAVSNQGSQFPFLEKIGDAFDNTGYVHIPNLRAFLKASDEQVNEMMIGDELVAWLKK